MLALQILLVALGVLLVAFGVMVLLKFWEGGFVVTVKSLPRIDRSKGEVDAGDERGPRRGMLKS